nr:MULTISPECIES: M17 family metallopeptidase [unclassified Streptomyces]
MKADMGGAAAVVGAVMALPRLGLPLRVRAHLPLAENMPDGGALRVGDVVRHRDGTSTEITHTDNEGRVLLADALSLASEPGRADVVIDVATLTSAAAHALGTRTGALLSADDALSDLLVEAGQRADTVSSPCPPVSRGRVVGAAAPGLGRGAGSGGTPARALVREASSSADVPARRTPKRRRRVPTPMSLVGQGHDGLCASSCRPR